jgi:putative DNA primase/helicase
MSTINPDQVRKNLGQNQKSQQSAAKKTKKTRQATALEIAQAYLDKHGQDTRFIRAAWHRYRGGVWAELHNRFIDHEVWRLLEDFEGKDRSRATLTIKNAVLDVLRARLFIPDCEVDTMHNLVNLGNGVYNLIDQKLTPHDPSYYLTTQLPFAYDEHADYSLWNAYLQTTFVKPHSTTHDPELTDFVQEAMGYSLTTSVRFHCTFWCYGEGANGKGVLFHILKQLAGEAAMPLNVGLLKREQYQLAMLAGKRVALCSEAASTNNLVEDALVKSIVGGDIMSVRQIRREPFELYPTCKLWWSMNRLPAVADTSEGFWRRVKVIPFNNTFATGKGRIMDLKYKLELELPGVFNWAMEGLRRLNSNGKFTEPQQVAEATEEYRREANPVEQFIEDKIEPRIGINTPSSSMYSAYRGWCLDNGYKPLSIQRFKNEMVRQGQIWDRKRRGAFYINVSLVGPTP